MNQSVVDIVLPPKISGAKLWAGYATPHCLDEVESFFVVFDCVIGSTEALLRLGYAL